MATFLLLIIYLTFISLGLPDSMLGAAWPLAYTDLGAPISMAGLVSICISGATVVSSLLSVRLIRRFGTGGISAISVFLTAAALLGISFTKNVFALCLLSIPLGLGGGSIDTALNNYVALHYRAVHMNLLHAFWGVGATAGPLLLSGMLTAGFGWREGYRAVAGIQFALALLCVCTLSLWKQPLAETPAAEREQSLLGNREALRIPGVAASMGCFFSYGAVETTTGLWAATYFIQVLHITPESAAGWASALYLGIMLGRMLSGAFSYRFSDIALLRVGQILSCVGAAFLLLPLPVPLPMIGVLFFGLGSAPVYPNMVRLTPARFGAAASQAVIGLEMASSYLANMLVPPLFGIAARYLGFQILPGYMLAVLSIELLLTWVIQQKTRSKEAMG